MGLSFSDRLCPTPLRRTAGPESTTRDKSRADPRSPVARDAAQPRPSESDVKGQSGTLVATIGSTLELWDETSHANSTGVRTSRFLKNVAALVAGAALSITSVGVAPAMAATAAPVGHRPVPVVYDSDLDFDDASTLAFLCQAHKQGRIELRAVTVVNNGIGTAGRSLTHARTILEKCGLPRVPVADGSPTGVNLAPPEARETFERVLTGALDDADRPNQPSSVTAAQLIAKSVLSSREPVTVLATGPLTNVATALREHRGVATEDRLALRDGRSVRRTGQPLRFDHRRLRQHPGGQPLDRPERGRSRVPHDARRPGPDRPTGRYEPRDDHSGVRRSARRLRPYSRGAARARDPDAAGPASPDRARHHVLVGRARRHVARPRAARRPRLATGCGLSPSSSTALRRDVRSTIRTAHRNWSDTPPTAHDSKTHSRQSSTAAGSPAMHETSLRTSGQGGGRCGGRGCGDRLR